LTRPRLTIVILCSAIVLLGAGLFWFLRAEATASDLNQPTGFDHDKVYTYVDREYGFTFQYPSSATVFPYWDEDGYRVYVPRPETKEGFTLLITPFDEAGRLTRERIHQDLPDLPMEDVSYVQLPALAEAAITFRSESQDTDEAYELWFIYDRHLYQFNAHGPRRELLDEVLDSLRFGEPWPGRL
jgi:hypothetical protein